MAIYGDRDYEQEDRLHAATEELRERQRAPQRVYTVTDGNQPGELESETAGQSIRDREGRQAAAMERAISVLGDTHDQSIIARANVALDGHAVQTNEALGAHRRLRESSAAQLQKARRSGDLAAVLGAVREDVAEGERYRQVAEGISDYDPEVPPDVQAYMESPDLEDVALTDPSDYDEEDDE